MKIKLSKTQWENIGKTAGWMKQAGYRDIDDYEVDNWISIENAKLISSTKNHHGGIVDTYLSQDRMYQLEVTQYEDNKTGKKTISGATEISLCGCGSGIIPQEEFDARGISVGLMCPACKKDRISKYRPEIFSDPDYEADEPIEEEI